MTSLQIERDIQATLGEQEFEQGKRSYSDAPRSEADWFKCGHFWRGLMGNAHSKAFLKSHKMWATQQHANIVPTGIDATFFHLRAEFGVIERNVRRLPMSNDMVTVPRPIGTVTANWVDEGDAIATSDLTIGGAEMRLRKLASLVYASAELDWDAVADLGQLLTESAASAFSQKIDEAAFNGNGESEFGHITGLSNTLHANATKTGSGATSEALTQDDWEDCAALLTDFPRAKPKWFMNRATYFASCTDFPELCEMVNGVRHFLGYPIEFTSVLDAGTTADTYQAFLGDLRLSSTMAYRRTLRAARSDDRLLDLDCVAFRQSQRIHIVHHETGATAGTRAVVGLKTST